MKQRDFIMLFGAAVAGRPLAARALQPVIGILVAAPAMAANQ